MNAKIEPLLKALSAADAPWVVKQVKDELVLQSCKTVNRMVLVPKCFTTPEQHRAYANQLARKVNAQYRPV